MTKRKITSALARIEASYKQGFILEALILNYHLNIDILKFLLLNFKPGYVFENKKIKVIVKDLSAELSLNTEFKSVLNKKSFKLVKTWLGKMEVFFKQLKLQTPDNSRQLANEAEKIFSVLNISVTKLHSKQKITS